MAPASNYMDRTEHEISVLLPDLIRAAEKVKDEAYR
jgi:hypothetical protein